MLDQVKAELAGCFKERLVTAQKDSQYILRTTGHTTTTSSVLAPRAVSVSATTAGTLVLEALFLACSFPGDSATSLLGFDAGAAAAALLAGAAFLGPVSGLAAFAAECSALTTASLAGFKVLLFPFTLAFRTSGTAVLAVPETGRLWHMLLSLRLPIRLSEVSKMSAMAKPMALDLGPRALAGALEGEDAEFAAVLVVLEKGAWVFLAARLPAWIFFFTGVCKAEGDNFRPIGPMVAPTPPQVKYRDSSYVMCKREPVP